MNNHSSEIAMGKGQLICDDKRVEKLREIGAVAERVQPN
jgi:hypothetical protein